MGLTIYLFPLSQVLNLHCWQGLQNIFDLISRSNPAHGVLLEHMSLSAHLLSPPEAVGVEDTKTIHMFGLICHSLWNAGT